MPERFRGGCSYGAGRSFDFPVSPAIVTRQNSIVVVRTCAAVARRTVQKWVE